MIEVAANAQEQYDSQQAQQKSSDWFLMHSLGLLGGETHNPDGTVSYTTVHVSTGRTKGDNIEYGNAIEITADNIDQLGLGDDIVTYGMDENGHFESELSGTPYDFEETNPEEFLVRMDSDVNGWKTDQEGNVTVTSMDGDEDPSFMMQPVTVNGDLQGYFIYGDKEAQYPSGVYVDMAAVDRSSMSDEMKAELFNKPEGAAVGVGEGLEATRGYNM